MVVRPKALRRYLPFWNQYYGAIQTTLGRITITSMQQRHHHIQSGRSRVLDVWKLSLRLLVILYTCPRIRTCGWETTRRQPTAMRSEWMLTASIYERAAQQAVCTTCCITATISISSQPVLAWL